MSIDLSKYRNGHMIAERRKRHGRTCRHLGRRLRSVDVPGCCGTSVTVSLHACGVHHRCSVDVAVGAEGAAAAGVPPFACCQGCSDWSPGDRSS